MGAAGSLRSARASGIAETRSGRGCASSSRASGSRRARVRRRGGGRKPITETDPSLVEDLERLVDPETRGDPSSRCAGPRRACASSPTACASSATRSSHQTVARLLRCRGYSLQANAKTRRASSHPDRDAQFRHINETATRGVAAGQPVISVDTKKKELVGDFKNGGRDGARRARPTRSASTTSSTSSSARRSPTASTTSPATAAGSTSGSTHDTAQFAVASIRAWWQHMGQQRYPAATALHDHRRLRRLQRQPHPALEDRAAAARRRDRA